MSEDTVDVQDHLDCMVDGFVGSEATNEEYEQVQELVSQAFCLGIERKQQEIESLKAQLEAKNNAIIFADECRQEWYELAMRKNKALQEANAQLAQYQSDDYVLVLKEPTNEMIEAGIEQDSIDSIYKAMIEAQPETELLRHQDKDWISVDERLPRNGQEVFAVDSIVPCQFVDGEFLEEFYEFDTGHSYEEVVDVKYWKPFPQVVKI